MRLNVLEDAVGNASCGMAASPGEMEVFEEELVVGITKSKTWAEKDLAEFTANVGVKCGHECSYCSSKATTRCHDSYGSVGRTPTETGYSIVDPESHVRIGRDAKRFAGQRGRVQFCSLTDGWSPESLKYDLGAKCVEAILKEPDWEVRVLSKNATVTKDFGLFKKYPGRVLVGLSVTAMPHKQGIVKSYEPYASSIEERMAALIEARQQGLRTYAMLCPLLPGVAANYRELLKLVEFSASHGAETIVVEPLNGRSDAMPATQAALSAAGWDYEADQVRQIRTREAWSVYAADLGVNARRAVTEVYGDDSRLRYLLYGGKLTPPDEARLRALGDCVKWLGK